MEIVEDGWRDPTVAHRVLGRPWQGETEFKVPTGEWKSLEHHDWGKALMIPQRVKDLKLPKGARWTGRRRTTVWAYKGENSSGASAPAEPVEVQLSHQMILLLVPIDGETLPELRHEDEYYVARVYPSGVKRTVVEREPNILSRDEALKHEKQCNQAMLDELKRWLNL